MKFCFEHLDLKDSDLVAAKGRAVASVAKNLSTKNIKLCKTNPISQMLKIL